MEYIGNILYDDQLCEESSIVIYGVGKIGLKICDFLENNNRRKNIKCFCDGNSGLWNTKSGDIDVISPLEAAQRYKEALFIIGGNYADQMISEAISLGVQRIHLLLV